MHSWRVERIVHFQPGDLSKGGFVHFGFHDRSGRHYLLEHQRHFLGLLGSGDTMVWTMAEHEVVEGVPNIKAEVKFPIYVDSLPDDRLVVSNFGDGRVFVVDVGEMSAKILVDGPSLGIGHGGNCVVDEEGCFWLSEVDGCRVWRFDSEGRPLLKLGDGTPGFQAEQVEFGKVKFNWIYDIRRGPDNDIYVLDSRNFAVRVIDRADKRVKTIAGTGHGGYSGDGGPAKKATFGSDPKAHFDGPISLSLDEVGNIFVGDRHNHVVRMIDKKSGNIETIAGKNPAAEDRQNVPDESDPLNLNLPMISSMDYNQGRLFVPTDLAPDGGDLAVLTAGSLRPPTS